MSVVDSKVYAEIVAIGNELCYGRLYDTNSYWIADQVTRLGVFVRRITCIRDNLGEMCSALDEALKRRPRFIFITGGLGPTPDDITIEALSKLTNRKRVVDEAVMKHMAERRNISVERVKSRRFMVKMLKTLEGAECLPNPEGFAPLTIINFKEATIVALPGPPREMKSCFTTHLRDRIKETTKVCSIARQVYVNMFESEVTPLITQILKDTPGIYIKYRAGKAIKDVGRPVEIIVFGESEETCQLKYEETVHIFKASVTEKGRKLIERE